MAETQDTYGSFANQASGLPPESPDDLAESRDKYLRLAAEFDNFKKRTRRDAELQATVPKDSVIRDMLPILDNLERAVACGNSSASQLLHQGVEMTLVQFNRLLQQHGIKATDDIGRTFDPHRHEAISLGHDSGQPDHAILEVIQRGYAREDHVFRPAKVIVNSLQPQT